jgi:flagellar L-ring protein precursor FlgH
MMRGIVWVALLPGLLGGCGMLSRLSEVGRPPDMSPITDPTKDASWRPVSMPMPNPQPVPAAADSLWRPGARAFFQDQRAATVGDIVTVLVNINDAANVKDVTGVSRSSTQTEGMPNLFGLENLLPNILPKPINPASLVSTNSTNVNTGTGQIQRNETVTLRLAGVVTQVLPNGNLVISAHQEFRVNGELRVLVVGGVIRPQDIASDNTVQHDRMAEARISYGGRGQLTEVQSPPVGQPVMNILLPF